MSGTAEDLEARDLTPTVVEGYKVSAKKTIRELSQLDAEDGTERAFFFRARFYR